MFRKGVVERDSDDPGTALGTVCDCIQDHPKKECMLMDLPAV